MTTSYPSGLDSFTNPTATDELDDEIGTRTHSEFHADTNDAIEAIQAELGTDPKGAAASVKARIAATETVANAALPTATAATTYQPLDSDLTAIAALTSAADKVPYSTGAGTWALADFSAAGRALVDDADASAQRTTLGLVIGTNVQAQDAELSAIAGLTSAADALPYFTGAGTAAVTTLTAAARTVLDDTTVGAMLATMGGATAASPTFTGVAGFADGAVGTPSITFSNDTNTGIYRTAADAFGATTGGVLRATFDATGLTVVGTLVTGAGGIRGQVFTSGAATGTAVAGYQNTGTDTTAVGASSATSNSGNSSTFVGVNAGYANSGLQSTGIGVQAGQSNTGASLMAMGYQSGYQNTGSSLTALGAYAGNTNTYNGCVLLGTQAAASGDNQFVVGSTTVPQNRWIPGHDNDNALDWGTANTLKILTGVAGTPTLRVTIDSAGLTIADAHNIVLNTTTGTKIGTGTTQKLGFYNATPIVQGSAVADATGAGDVVAQLNALLARIRSTGLIAT